MPVFDSHTHIFPDAIAAAVLASLGEQSGIAACTDGTHAGLLASMRTAGIAGALNCPIATKPEQVPSLNRWAAAHNQWPILCLGSMHPDYAEPEVALAALVELGLPGIKLHPEYQNFDPLEPRMQPIWQACSDLELLVVMHAGGDVGFTAPFHSDPVRIRRLVEKFPRLQLIAAHAGSWQMWREVAADLAGAAVYFDLAFTLGVVPDALLLEIIAQHGSERILFATDSPWRDQHQELAYFHRLQLPAEQAEQILWTNAKRLFGGQPAWAPVA